MFICFLYVSLSIKDFFQSYVHYRAILIAQVVASYPHFGESHRILFEYDRKECLQLQCDVMDMITQCSCLYDSLIKNFDKVLKAKEQCKGQARGPKSDNTTNRDGDNFSTNNNNNNFYS